MKKILLSIFSLTLLMCMNLNAQSERLVFVEEFTQASCAPCEASTPMLNTTLDANADKVIQLRYQTSWPGVDPMNADNVGEVADRVTYYGVTGVPNLFMDGVDPNAAFPILITDANINANYSADGAPVKVEVSHLIAADLDSMEITVRVTNEGTAPYMVASNRLRVAVVEEVIEWRLRPGSTSILDYEYVMKNFVTGTPGMELTEIAALGGFWENTWNVAVPANVYNFNEMAVVAFIQDDSNKSVVNAGKSESVIRDDYPELASYDAGSGSTAFCDYDYSPAIEVTNHGGGVCTGYEVSASLNGTVIETKTVAEALMGGESATITFEDVLLEPGANAITYAIESTVERDIGYLNAITTPLNFSKASNGGLAELTIGFEDETSGTTPSNGSVSSDYTNGVFTVFNAAGVGGSGAIGGFGESDQAMMVNFWQWNPASVDANGSMTVLDQWLVPDNGDTTFVTFDYAYTSWQSSNDRLIVEVSSDCGATFTEMFNKAGAELLTTPELNLGNAFLIPSADDWVNVELDITDWAGEIVMVRFSVVSAWGDQLWIDNINTETRMVSSNENLVDVQGLEVFPNPASDFATVSFELVEAKNVRLTLVDNLGRVVSTQNYGTRAGSQNISLDLSDLTNGIYMLRGQFGDEISLNKISVTK